MTLKARAENGSSCDAARSTSAPVFGSSPIMGGTSSGLGR